MMLVAEQRQDLQSMLTVVDMVCKKLEMAISAEKSKVLSVGSRECSHPVEQSGPGGG